MRSSPLFLLVLFLSHSGPGNGDTGRRRVVFDPAHFGVQRTMFPELGRIHAVDISDNGKYLVSGGQNGGISVIRTSDWSLSWKGSYPLGSITSIAFCPRSEIFAVAGSTSGLIYLVNAKSRTDFRILEGEGFPLHDLAWFPDGKRLVSAVGTGAVRIWNAKTGQTERVLRVHRGAVYTLALNRFHLVTGGADGAVRIYDTAEWKEVGGIQNPGLAVKHLRLTRDGKTLYGTTQGAITSLRAWDLASGKILESKVVAPGKSVSGIQMDATGRYLVLAVGTDLQVWSRFPLKLVETCRYHRVAIEALEYSGRTGWMVVGGGIPMSPSGGESGGGCPRFPRGGFSVSGSRMPGTTWVRRCRR